MLPDAVHPDTEKQSAGKRIAKAGTHLTRRTVEALPPVSGALARHARNSNSGERGDADEVGGAWS